MKIEFHGFVVINATARPKGNRQEDNMNIKVTKRIPLMCYCSVEIGQL